MEDSAEQLSAFVDRVLAATGAAKVDIVGHSEGSLMPDYYVKFLGGAAKVDKIRGAGHALEGTNVALASNLAEIGDHYGMTPAFYEQMRNFCESCEEFITGSDFMHKMNLAGVADPAVTYTNIVTRFDELVWPSSSGLMDPRPNVATTSPEGLPARPLEHLTVIYDPVAETLVTNALDPAHPRPVPCTLVLPGVGAPHTPRRPRSTQTATAPRTTRTSPTGPSR